MRRPSSVFFALLRMLSVGDAGRSVRTGTFAGAFLISPYMPRPFATRVAIFSSTFASRPTTRSRTALVSTLLSSKMNAETMWFCSGSVWLAKNRRAWL